MGSAHRWIISGLLSTALSSFCEAQSSLAQTNQDREACHHKQLKTSSTPLEQKLRRQVVE